jgi:hypothetical protein
MEVSEKAHLARKGSPFAACSWIPGYWVQLD